MHLISVNDLNDEQARQLIHLAIEYRINETGIQSSKTPVALIFLEPSTRTRVSFERAAQITGRRYILLNNLTSSMEKGETLEDTVLNLNALGLGMFVIRNGSEQAMQALKNVGVGSIINAGDGTNEHPTQALLDLATLYKKFNGKLDGLKMAIVGDLRHSRVAKSFSFLAPRFGIKLSLISPSAWKPFGWGENLPWYEKTQGVIGEFDVLMALRVQKERMDKVESLLQEAYVEDCQISQKNLRPHQYFMHPGPVNWGVELNIDLKNDPRSLILKQAEMGLSMRAVVLDYMDRK